MLSVVEKKAVRDRPSQRDTTEEFIDKARKVHGDLYDYSKVEYKNSAQPVVIIDPDYGEFTQTPMAHYGGSGHPLRGIATRTKALSLTQEEFVQRAREVHGDLYDYSLSEYKGIVEPVLIIDPDYGEFWQTPAAHLGGVVIALSGLG